jgi:hypothetical protein
LIGIILAYPYPYSFQRNVKLTKLYFFPAFKNTAKNIENYDTDEKDKTVLSGIAVNKSKMFDFPTCVKLGVGYGSGCG